MQGHSIFAATAPASNAAARRMRPAPPRLTHLVFLVSSLVAIFNIPSTLATGIRCANDQHCRTILQFETSECLPTGYCSNPFHKNGCLGDLLPKKHKFHKTKRVCHSEDPPSALENGHCQLSPFEEYKEVRIVANGWESTILLAWLLQILLSELLHVPVSIEARDRGSNDDFYDVHSRMDYSSADAAAKAIENSYRFKDCRNVQSHNEQPDNDYVPCAHLDPEIWEEGNGDRLYLIEQGYAEPYQEMGALGEQYWFIPKFLALEDPSLVSYAGLMGEQNRRKLAETFGHPTNWKDYCELVSNDNCTSPTVFDPLTNETITAATTRPPDNANEAAAYFVEGRYTGHFRKTDANDCDKNPDTCHGHITDYPCSWTSFTPQLTHNLNIALKSYGYDTIGGYSYSHLNQIWAAANATKSPVIMMYWKPEPLFQRYLSTDSELTHVILPPPTQICKESREHYVGRCTNDTDAHKGSEFGICDNSPQTLSKLISSALKELAQDPMVDPELWSPAYQTIKNYKITELHLGDLLSRFMEQQLDPSGFDPRNAVCQWAAENIDLLESFIPETYPRVVEEQDTRDEPIFITAAVLANCLMVLLIVCIFFTYRKRNTKAMYYIQPSFLYFLEGGLFLVIASAWQMTVPSEAASCAVSPWLESIGYYFALAPLLIRINEINKLLASGKQMRRVKVGKRRLLWSVFVGTCFVAAYVAIWTVVDPPTQRNDYDISDESAKGNGFTIVTKTTYCGSSSNAWKSANVAWQLLLLFVASVLAFMVSHVREDVNDIRPLSVLILSHFFFSTLRLALVLLHDSVDPVMSMAYMALIMIAECFVALVVFIFPKLAEKSENYEEESATLPDLYLRTTILYADIKGFSAWSSLRDPAQVFRFLEFLFSSIDQTAEQKGVYRVEAIAKGTYVAATGIPQQRKDHAVTMGRFATDVMSLFSNLIDELEVVYGPDTGNLDLQIGIHSGPVTGGFLKGKSARFQLFGETATIARQLCSSGERGKIQISETTADLLLQAGKRHWVKKRDITADSSVTTYWLSKNKVWGSTLGMTLADSSVEDEELQRIAVIPRGNEQRNRLITWNVSILHDLLKQIYARRAASGGKLWNSERHDQGSVAPLSKPLELDSNELAGDVPLDEVKEIIFLPAFDNKIAKRQRDWDEVVVPTHVMDQLRYFVASVADLYPEHPFHNFAHASHVVMSTVKHLKRIVVPADLDLEKDEDLFVKHKTAAALHDHTYGITSDPLTQFACVFSSLVHDISHPGVPNINFVKEDPTLAGKYKNRSVSEQRSVAVSWDLLMKPELEDLRFAICGDNEGLARFRQLLVNTIVATDLGDKELRKLRSKRWNNAFRNPEGPWEDSEDLSTGEDLNRKATIVIEHLIQASNVCHTTQHWEIYREWSGKLFEELYAAYREGRSDRNPSEFWYEGELGFFDYYVIPLSKKLHECGTFGVSSDENLNYATRNRELWYSQGKKVTEELLQRCKEKWDTAQEMTEHAAESEGSDLVVEKEPIYEYDASSGTNPQSTSESPTSESLNETKVNSTVATQVFADVDETSQNSEHVPVDEAT